MRRWLRFLSLGCLLLLFLTGCSAEPNELPEETTKGAALQGDYTIYTLNKAGTKLSGYGYNTESRGAVLVEELLEEVKWAPGGTNQKSAMPENLYVQRYELTNQVLYLHFDGNYRMMDSITEVLCRATLAKTLTQIAGVEYISVYVDNQPLLDVGGSPIGYVKGSDFIENVSDVEDTSKMTTLKLYFANESGTKLVAETRTVQVTNQTISQERMILNELLAGPQEEGHYATLPTTIKVNSLQVKSGICYLNVSAAFVKDALNINEYVAVYSLVNSLTELTSINKVQLMIDGSSAVTFRGSISFESPLERKMEYVE